MADDLIIRADIIIPEHEIEVATSRSGGAGGQHVNKSDTRVTIRWNIHQTRALTDEQKQRVLQKLAHRLTKTGDLIIHQSASRSQLQNKKSALLILAHDIRAALHEPVKRKEKYMHALKESRLKFKKQRSAIKKQRGRPLHDE